MTKLQTVWEVINGHKTNIGTFLITVYTFAVELEIITSNPTILSVLAIVFGVGVAHKGVKYTQSTK
jgi:hypothetical protein